ncbi:hypothetical protein NDU88_002852 [Pleurodeles waltl]|uniref:Uncharacterized protein n=1 Tax=Pleurodeles waltl TaxID=8319 RepID=A0AAV7T4G5_PLEWA|nr:hypothetical protein NDU88_002852 [Pleurodeles waltl]
MATGSELRRLRDLDEPGVDLRQTAPAHRAAAAVAGLETKARGIREEVRPARLEPHPGAAVSRALPPLAGSWARSVGRWSRSATDDGGVCAQAAHGSSQDCSWPGGRSRAPLECGRAQGAAPGCRNDMQEQK